METLTTTLETVNKGRWQWQSNPDPWSKTEASQWESYSLDHSNLIEKAYYDQQKEVDLGDYLVYPLELLQRKKGNMNAQRPIRRIDWMDDEEVYHRSARYFDSELPKTINRIFGGLGDFMSFFSRRNQEMLDFTSHFQELEKSNDLDILNQKITPKLVHSLEEVLLKPLEDQLKSASITPFKKKTLTKIKERIEELISPFQKIFSSFEEFYGQILRAYTMNTDLYPDLNKYLRNESWMEIDKLLPYAFCLCKAFFSLNLKKENPGRQDPPEKPTFTSLYRGTAFDEFALSFYDKGKLQYFSWNSVTSTTTNEKLAEEFMYNSVNIEKKKDPVMFIIEVPDLMESEEYVKWLDIRKYSAIPKEDEVILPPGSVFELVQVFTDPDKKTTIKIKLKNEVQSLAYGGMMMQGILQSQMMTEKEAKIMCLEGEELSQALMSFHGNQLTEEVEFCLCLFDDKLLQKMLEILPTIEKLKTLKFISCIYEGNRQIPIEKLKSNGVTKIEIVEANDFFQMICNENLNQDYWKSLQELDLDFQSQKNLEDQDIHLMVSQGLKYFTQLTDLKMKFEGCEDITDEGVKILASDGLKSFPQLRSLILNFEGSHQITDKGVYVLASQGLKNLSQLASLTLNLNFCNEITDEGVRSLASEGLKNLPQLSSLDLAFEGCNKITGAGVLSLASEGLLVLSQLTSLALCFVGCQQITDKFFTLAAQGFECLAQLTSLNLDFEWCPEITDKGLKSFASNGLKHLVQLASLTLSFKSCPKITDAGLKNLASNIQEYLVQLKSLTLGFGECKKITDEGLGTLGSCLLTLHSQLTILSLTFFDCERITSQGIKNLASQGLQSLTQLTSLFLDFYKCKQITCEGVKFLMSEGLQDLSQLTFLDLNFRSCNKKIDEETQNLASDLAERFTHLSSLIVNEQNQPTASNTKVQPIPDLAETERMKFIRHKVQPSFEKKEFETQEVPDSMEEFEEEDPIEELLDIIISMSEQNQDTLKTPKIFDKFGDLNSFTLHFEDYEDIYIDKVLQRLTSHAFPHLTQLKSLTLYCYMRNKKRQITDEGMNILAQGLQYLTQLTALELHFSNCERITDKGVISLSRHGLKHLSQLNSLNLNFFYSSQITDEGVERLASDGLRSIIDLTSLTLAFTGCKKITDKGVMNLAWHGLRHLTQLNSFSLALPDRITAEGVTDLAWYGLRHLLQLKSLSLNSADGNEFTNEALSNLASQGLRYLSKLNSLSLICTDCLNLSDEGVINFTWYGLRHLSQLKSLNLSFAHRNQITDEGIDVFVFKGLKNLKQLTSLALDISQCDYITDSGINNLILRGIKNLPQLTALDLLLAGAVNITNFTIRNIVKILHYFGFTKEIEENLSDSDTEEILGEFI